LYWILFKFAGEVKSVVPGRQTVQIEEGE
jgi:hypothetical protein